VLWGSCIPPPPRFSDRHPPQPGSGMAIAAVCPESSMCQHERLLCRVLCLVHASEDPVARAKDPGGLPFDEDAERVSIPSHECSRQGVVIVTYR
jgi:hypothetical protein